VTDLTPAQERVVALVAEGLSTPEAAARLGMAVSTARTHVKAAQARLGVHTLQGLAAWHWRRRMEESEKNLVQTLAFCLRRGYDGTTDKPSERKPT